jgi:hypothetical protein
VSRVFTSFVGTLPLSLLAVAALNFGAPGEVKMASECASAWCQNDRQNDYASRDAVVLLREQVRALGCSTDPALTPRVAVAPAEDNVTDRGVVKVVTFDEGWKLAKAGRVYVLGWCA